LPKLKKFRVNFISILKEEEPANGKRAIYKTADGRDFRFEFDLRHFRKDAKRGLVYGTVYGPDEVDTQKDWAGREEIADAAHLFLMEKRVDMVDIDHDYEPYQGTVVESFIKNGPDDRFPDAVDGSWVVVIKLSKEAMTHIDEIKGLSMAGGGQYDETAAPPTRKAKRPAIKSVTKQRALVQSRKAGRSSRPLVRTSNN
jgi:hypothetical protein